LLDKNHLAMSSQFYKKVIYLLFFIYAQALFPLQAQISDTARLKRILTSPNYCTENAPAAFFYTNRQIISTYTMNRLLRKDLSLITLGEEGLPSIGNYATLNYKENDTRVNLHLSFYNPLGRRNDSMPIRSILSVNVDAGLNEGVSALFTNKNLNNKAGISLRWSFLSRKTRYINTSRLDCATLDLYRQRLFDGFENEENQFMLDSLTINKCNRVRIADGVLANLYRDTIKGLQERLAQSISNSVRCDRLDSLKITTERYYKHQSDANMGETARQLYRSGFNETRIRHWKDRAQVYFDSLYKIESTMIRWEGFTIQWWDVEASVNGEKYNLLNASLPDNDQLSRKSFNRWQAGFTFNRFSSTGHGWLYKHGFLFKAGYKIGNDNNLGGADLEEVITTKTTVSVPGKERTATIKSNAYTIPFASFFSHNINLQFSKYLNNEKTRAVNLRVNGSIGFDEMKNILNPSGKPDITAGLGYFLTFRDAKEKKGIVNVEVFLNFSDIFNAAGSEDRFFERHQLGLKFGVPFRSIFIND
jgi:hypothetical protein